MSETINRHTRARDCTTGPHDVPTAAQETAPRANRAQIGTPVKFKAALVEQVPITVTA